MQKTQLLFFLIGILNSRADKSNISIPDSLPSSISHKISAGHMILAHAALQRYPDGEIEPRGVLKTAAIAASMREDVTVKKVAAAAQDLFEEEVLAEIATYEPEDDFEAKFFELLQS